MTELARKTASGASLNLIVTVTRTVTQFAIVLPILARLLPPEKFGLVGMAMTLVAFLTMFNDLGISAALVRADHPNDRFWTSAFWTNTAMGASFTLVAFLTAPALAAFFQEPVVEPLARTLSIVLLMHCIFLVPMAWLQRNFRFGTIAAIDLCSILLSAIVAIWAAMSGYGVWALVFQQLTIYGVKMAGGLAVQRAPLLAGYDFGEIARVLGFSLKLTGANFITFVNRNTDKVLIGRILGAEALGFYGRAYQIMLVPVHSLAVGVNFALYPATSSIKSDMARLGRLYLRVISVLGAVIVPMMTGLAIVATPFVAFVFGPNWAPVRDVLVYLCFAGIIQSMIATTNVIWTTLGQSGVLLRWSLIRMVAFVAAFIIGVRMGSIEALAAAYLIPNIVLFGPYLHGTLKRIGLGWGHFAGALGPPLISTVVMSAALWAIQVLVPTLADWPAHLQLAVLVPGGMIAYGLAMLVLFHGYVREMLREARQLVLKQAPEPAE